MFKKSVGIEVLAVVATFVLAVLFSVSPLAQYDLQLVAILFIFYFFFKRVTPAKEKFVFVEVLIFVFVITSTVFSTGGINSPFFFLLYFLLFAIALILEPISSLVLTIAMVIMFMGISDTNSGLRDLLPVFSLPFIAPFAKYLGDLQRKYYRQKEQLKSLEKSKAKSVATQSFEKEQTLMFLTTVLHSHLEDVDEHLKNFMGDSDLDYLKEKTKELKKTVEGFRTYVEKIN